jgi:hypothetical protein
MFHGNLDRITLLGFGRICLVRPTPQVTQLKPSHIKWTGFSRKKYEEM